MAYINQSGTSAVNEYCKIKIYPAEYHYYNRDTDTTIYENYDIQVDLPTNISMDYPPTTLKSGYIGYFDHLSSYAFCWKPDATTDTRYFEGTEFTFELHGNENFKELITPSVSMTSWRTGLKTNTGRSDCNVSYDDDGAYGTYLLGYDLTNDFLETYRYPTYGDPPYFYPRAIHINKTTNSVSGNHGTGGSREWRFEFEASQYNFGDFVCHLVSTNTSSNEYVDFTLSGRKLIMKGVTNNTTSNVSLPYPNTLASMSFNFQIDDSNFTGISTSQLQFAWGNRQWNGLVSPTYTFSSESQDIRFGDNVFFTIDRDRSTASPPFNLTTTGAVGWHIDASPLPENIGNIKLLNPEYLNDYTQESTVEEGEESEAVRNNIVKIIPTLNAHRTDLFNFRNESYGRDYIRNTFSKSEWVGVNCTITQDGDDYFISNVREGAYIYQTPLRQLYESEVGNLPDLYLQRHFTKFRYLESEFRQCDESETEPDWQPFSPPLTLKYLPYGDMTTGHTWTANIYEIVDENTKLTGLGTGSSERYGDTLYDLSYCNKQASSSVDNYAESTYCEYLRLYNESAVEGDPEYGWKYTIEYPQTNYGYLPNVVGRVEIQLEQGKVYKIGDMYGKCKYSLITIEGEQLARVNRRKDIKDEFTPMANIGVRNPKPEGEESDEWQYYQSRYIVISMDGMHSMEIPQTAMSRNPNREADVYDVFTMGDLYVNESVLNPNYSARMIHPRDDIGELKFNVSEFTPDDDGHKHINALTQGKDIMVYWLKETGVNGSYGGGNSYPRFDTLSGDELWRYIRRYHTIYCSADFGASVNGININHGSLIASVSDTSAYPNENLDTEKYGKGVYHLEEHGTRSTIYLNQNNRVIEKVYDGGKFWYSIFRALSGKILRNSIGKILHNSEGKILRGNDYD